MATRIYTQLIRKYLYLYPCVFITGPRQSGKSSLIPLIFDSDEKPRIMLNLEKDEDADQLRFPEKYFHERKNSLFIIDEIQRMPSLFEHIRILLSQHGNGIRFLLMGTGSEALLSLQHQLGPKAAVRLEVTPLNCLETSDLADPLTHWFAGGFSIPLQMQDNDLRPVWYASYLRGLAERDLPLAGLREHPEKVRRILPLIAQSTGEELNKAEIIRQLGLRPEVLNDILNALSAIGIIRTIESFPGSAGKRIVRSPRYYFTDTGLLHYLLGIRSPEQLQVSSYAAASWANYVINQVASTSFSPLQLRYYQTHDGAGCDMVLLKGKKPVLCISAQHTEKPVIRRGFTTAIRDMGTRQNIIAIPGKIADEPLQYNIRCCDTTTLCRRIQDIREKHARKVYVPMSVKEDEGF